MKKPELKYKIISLFKYTIFLLLLIFICSCATPRHGVQGSIRNNHYDLSGDILGKVNLLQHDLTALKSDIDTTEARLLAETSISYSMFLADEYRLVWPPYLHNILVRVGIKERGLCYHWTEDLMKHLASLNLKSFTLHQGVARKGSDLREHNSVVVTARGQDFIEGIVLDPWRDSGRLYWVRVKADRYPWEER